VAVFVTFTNQENLVGNFTYPDVRVSREMGRSQVTPFLEDSAFSFQLQLGSKLWPEQPMSSLAEMYETLRKAVGTHNQDIKSISLDRSDYLGTRLSSESIWRRIWETPSRL
jgi:hypothetical protein